MNPLDGGGPGVNPLDGGGPGVNPLDGGGPGVNPLDGGGPGVNPLDGGGPGVNPLDGGGPGVNPLGGGGADLWPKPPRGGRPCPGNPVWGGGAMPVGGAVLPYPDDAASPEREAGFKTLDPPLGANPLFGGGPGG